MCDLNSSQQKLGHNFFRREWQFPDFLFTHAYITFFRDLLIPTVYLEQKDIVLNILATVKRPMRERNLVIYF